MAEDSLDGKLARMQDILRSLGRVAVAFSAGVDSTFVLKVAADVLGPANVVAVTARSESLPAAELDEAASLARRFGVEHVVLHTRELEDPEYLSNPIDRCYHCRSELYGRLDRLLADRGLGAVVNGINADDASDWRPGTRAAREHGVRSPCAEAGLTKQEIRALSARLGLSTAGKPASPCLASRIPYHERITPEKLRRIEQSESFLRSLGFAECRVRHHENLARIEMPPADIDRAMQPATRARIEAALRGFGYAYVTIDLRGFRSGSLNEVISPGPPPA